MNIVLRSASVLALAAAALAASAQNLVQDPGFESAVGTLGTQTFYSAGQSIDGGSWTVGNPPSGGFGSFAVDKNPNFAISGTVGADINGASVRQTLATVPGTVYLVSFDAYGFLFPPNPVSVSVGFGGTTTSLLVSRPTSFGPVTGATHVSFLQTATDASTVLSFGGVFRSEIELDNVSVVAQPVPEPATMATLGLGAVVVLKRRKRA